MATNAVTAVFLVATRLTSGSIVTNTHTSHEVANLTTDSITVDLVGVTNLAEYTGAVAHQEIELTVRYHSAYDIGPLVPATVRTRMDEIENQLRTDVNFSTILPAITGFYMKQLPSLINYQIDFPESQTRGAEMSILIHTTNQYTQV